MKALARIVAVLVSTLALALSFVAVTGSHRGARAQACPSPTPEPSPAPTPTPEQCPQPQIVFVRALRAGDIIVLTDPNGSDEVQVTGTDRGQSPVWSPDGTKLAFISWKSNYYHVYVADLAGDSWKRVTKGRREFFEPAWSPDGQQIVFSIGPRAGKNALGIVNVNGSGQRTLVESRKYWSLGFPSFSPNGNKISFNDCNYGLARPCFIKTMRPDGSRVRKLTRRGNSVNPVWSPDGQKIAYEKWSGSDYNIHSMNVDGSHKRRLTGAPTDESEPAWSPDGSLIAFTKSGRQLGVMKRNGSAERRLTKSGWNWSPAWSSDGSSLVFLRTVNGYYDVFTIKADGNERTRITRTNVPEFEPSWQPMPPSDG